MYGTTNQLTSSESLFGPLPDCIYNFGFHGSKQLSMGNERVDFWSNEDVYDNGGWIMCNDITGVTKGDREYSVSNISGA